MLSRIGLHSGEVVVRAIRNDLHMDYSAVGQTTHLAARMEQVAPPGTIVLTAATAQLPESRDTREQAIDLRLALRSALQPSGDSRRMLAALREAEAIAEALADPRRLAQVSG